MHSIPIPGRSIQEPPFSHGELSQRLCIGHRNSILYVVPRPSPIVRGEKSADVDRKKTPSNTE